MAIAGSAMSFHCTIDARFRMSIYTMQWYRQAYYGAPVQFLMMEYEQATKKMKVAIVQAENKFSLHISDLTLQDNGIYYLYCANANPAYFGAGTKLTVLDPDITIQAPTVTVLNVSKNEVCTKENVTLVCVAKGFYPDHVNVYWTVDDENRTTDVSTDEAAVQGSDKYYTISSRLNINYKTEWTRGKTFTCIVTFYDGKYKDYKDIIIGPKLTIDGDNYETYVRSVKTTMLAYGMFVAKSIAYGLFIMYIVRRQPSVPLSWCSLCQALCQRVSFADLKFGPGTRLTVLEPNMTITTPTVKLLPPSPDELCYAQKNREKVTLVCLATDFYPDHVSITWQVNGKEKKNNVATDHVAQQATSTSLYSMSSRLRVDQIEWTNIKNNFTCIVTFYNGHDYLRLQSNIKFSPAKIPPRVYNTVQFGYLMFLSKSLLYAVFVSVMVWKCKATKEKTLMTENGDIMIS
ncbi:M1-specific T cell receptor beta chain-like [Ictalurus furcatus]|uniref:M1-specific T cell receptor beta chain-like n=1 Tax=Ictalurus furcatus TaxID=66913 RepID=UPI002350FB94|nr:M1-specific T cell receptor beta chain-like [Ictalurus furcatus]